MTWENISAADLLNPPPAPVPPELSDLSAPCSSYWEGSRLGDSWYDGGDYDLCVDPRFEEELLRSLERFVEARK
jgi:hypothetical protein